MEVALLELSFEQAAEELEELVDSMENSVLPLEEMLTAYERGMRLAQLCGRRLSDAEKRIETIKRLQDGTVTLAPLDVSSAPEAIDAPPPAARRQPSQNAAPGAAAPPSPSPAANDDEDDDELSLF